MKNLIVFFGGKSCEHDISIITAVQAISAADKSKYIIRPIYVGREGGFYIGKDFDKLGTFRNFNSSKAKAVYLRPADNGVYSGKKRLFSADCALMCMHGLNGEDGSLQGLLELSGIPYTSPSVMASALSMDKIVSKFFFKGLGLKVVPFAWFDKADYIKDRKKVIATVEKLKYPIIVKPSNLGSSIGISVCRDREGLEEGLEIALGFDNRVLVEKALEDFIEINCSVIGNCGEAKASACEQPVKREQILSFADKYLAEGGKKSASGMQGMLRALPAPIPDEKTAYIRESSEKVFLALGMSGVIRIDYILEGENAYINEVNTIPGSLSYYFWEHEGKSFSELIDGLVEGAIAERKRKDALTYAFKSEVLKGGKGK
jgi:D-alanine-D-alanine ligase